LTIGDALDAELGFSYQAIGWDISSSSETYTGKTLGLYLLTRVLY